VRAEAVVLAALAGATLLTGCGKSSHTSPAQLALEREDLVFASRALQSLEGQSEAEVAATRAAWPLIANGLPRRRSGLYPPRVRAAIESAEHLELPTIFEERDAAAMSGPANEIVGLYREFTGLAQRGWAMIGGAIYQIEHGTPQAARFARENLPLYIDSVYDAHFGLAQIGKKLLPAYKKLGGQAVFGEALKEDEVNAIANFYSEARNRLEPHAGVKLGS
jgi:hypothetical protein